MLNPWRVLGVHRQSEEAELYAAYIKRAKKLHPDKGGDAGEFTELNAAYSVLKDKKALSKLLRELTAYAGLCLRCDGRGVKFKGKGITGRTAERCNLCGGAGFIINEREKKYESVKL